MEQMSVAMSPEDLAQRVTEKGPQTVVGHGVIFGNKLHFLVLLKGV